MNQTIAPFRLPTRVPCPAYQNNGVTSLQEVPHFHVHVVPRREAGGWGAGPPHISALHPRATETVRRAVVSWERAEELATLVKSNYSGQA